MDSLNRKALSSCLETYRIPQTEKQIESASAIWEKLSESDKTKEKIILAIVLVIFKKLSPEDSLTLIQNMEQTISWRSWMSFSSRLKKITSVENNEFVINLDEALKRAIFSSGVKKWSNEEKELGTSSEEVDEARRRLFRVDATEINLKGKLSYPKNPNSGLQTVPREIHCFVNLKKLNLSHNRLNLLPPEIGSITTLEFLDLNQNLILILPREIYGLKKLTTLDVSHNRIEALEGIEGLSALEYLFAEDNSLKELPSSIVELQNLKLLAVRNNFLELLPIGLAKFPRLSIREHPQKNTNLDRSDSSDTEEDLGKGLFDDHLVRGNSCNIQ